jgi:HK97 family phage prohead protease
VTLHSSIIDHGALPLDIKAAASGIIQGYASLYGQIDNGGDVVAPGAYTKSLASLAAEGRSVKMLWQHDPAQPIGVWDEIREDAKGLWVKGRILPEVEKGREASALLAAGAIDGLSIGYRTVNATRGAKGERILQQLELWEVSVVTFPMLPTARVDAMKAADMTERDFERMLTRDAGLSRSVAQRLMAGGYDAVKAMRDAGDGADELVQLLKARLSL